MIGSRQERVARFDRLVGAGADPDDLKSDSVRGGAFSAAAEGIDFFLRLGSIAVLARLLVPEHFGLIAMVLSVTTVAERFKDLGLSIATVQRKDLTHDQVSTLFWINGGLGLLSGLVVALLAVPIARFFHDDRLIGITLAIAASFVWSGLTIQHQALLRRTMRFGYIAIISVCASLLSIVVAILMAMNDYGYWALVAREVSRSAFLAIGIWGACRWIPDAPSRNTGAWEMMRFGGSLALVQLATLFSLNFGSIVIGRVFGAGPVGLYRQGYSLVLGPFTQLTYPIWSVSEAALSRMQDDFERYRSYYRRLLTLFSGITMPLAAFLAIHAEQIVLVFLGADWIEATPIFRIMAIASFLYPAATTISLVMITSGQSTRLLWLGLMTAACLMALCLLGAMWGPSGVAAAHIFTTLLMLGPRLYFGLRGTPVGASDFFASIARPAMASLLMAAVLWLLERNYLDGQAFTTLVIGGIAGPLLYLSLWTALPGGRHELVALTRALSSAIQRRKAAP
jgi:O-antigen/teichoic acid export membrane protein